MLPFIFMIYSFLNFMLKKMETWNEKKMNLSQFKYVKLEAWFENA